MIDEVVKGRGEQDDAYVQWLHMPLQGHFLGTVDAGDMLCDRMREVLREPAAESVVVTCFQRVMLLGFLGGYRSLNDPQREKLVAALNAQVSPLSEAQAPTVLAESKGEQASMAGCPAGHCVLAYPRCYWPASGGALTTG